MAGTSTGALSRGSAVTGWQQPYLLRERDVMPWTSWMTSPWRTGRGGLLTTSSCLAKTPEPGPPRQDRPPDGSQVTYLPGSFTIHQLLMSLKG